MRFINDITKFIFIDDEPQKADIIFIPGGTYSEVAETAALLWHHKYAPIILPSGKFSITKGYFPGHTYYNGKDDSLYKTEWEFLYNVLIENGVDEEAILKEDSAEFTYQNALNSRKVTDELNLNISKAIICCKAFHARRCLMYYQLCYPETEFFICPTETQGINKENWYKSENGIKKVLGELQRCGSQFTDIFPKL